MVPPRLEPTVLGRRVHVGEQPVAVAEGVNLGSRHDAYAHIFEKSDLRELCNLALEYRPTADFEGALVAPAEPTGPAAGKTGRARPVASILPPG